MSSQILLPISAQRAPGARSKNWLAKGTKYPPAIVNEQVGNLSGGDPFECREAQGGVNIPVAVIEIWAAWVYIETESEPIWGLSGLQVTFANHVVKFYGTKSDTQYRYDFHEDSGERFLSMSLSGNHVIQGVKAETTMQKVHVGGGGRILDQRIGNGKLVGFVGRSGQYVDALGSVFE